MYVPTILHFEGQREWLVVLATPKIEKKKKWKISISAVKLLHRSNDSSTTISRIPPFLGFHSSVYAIQAFQLAGKLRELYNDAAGEVSRSEWVRLGPAGGLQWSRQRRSQGGAWRSRRRWTRRDLAPVRRSCWVSSFVLFFCFLFFLFSAVSSLAWLLGFLRSCLLVSAWAEWNLCLLSLMVLS